MFELSKVERVEIRERMVANLRNVDDALAAQIGDGLGMARLPKASNPAAAPITDLAPSAALSILQNGPASFAGRKVGVLVTNGASASVVSSLRTAVTAEGAVLEVIAPTIGGVDLDDGSHLAAQQKVGGGPSVLYDSVAIVVTTAGAGELALLPAAKDFVADAHAHKKFIADVPDAAALFAAAGLDSARDDGYVDLTRSGSAKRFIERCQAVRYWDRP